MKQIFDQITDIENKRFITKRSNEFKTKKENINNITSFYFEVFEQVLSELNTTEINSIEFEVICSVLADFTNKNHSIISK